MYKDLILVINPRAIFTRIAVYQHYNILFLKDVQHPDDEIGRYSHYLEQIDYRRDKILAELNSNGIEMDRIMAVVGRGGLLKPVKSGIYEMNNKIVTDLKSVEYGEDVVDLGGLLAYEIGKVFPEMRSFIVDPVTVDEYHELARFTGHPLFERKSAFHPLNQKAMAKRHAKAVMREYEEMNLIVVHLGSGISVGAHCKGLVIDANQVLDGDAAFSPERCGTLPVGDLVRYCYRSGKTETEVLDMIMHKGGLYAYLGTYSALEVDARVNHGDKKAALVFEAMAYQVSKEIGAMFAVLNSQVDGIIITGGIANSRWFVNKIIERVGKMAPIHIYPGVVELDSMAQITLSAMRGDEPILVYE